MSTPTRPPRQQRLSPDQLRELADRQDEHQRNTAARKRRRALSPFTAEPRWATDANRTRARSKGGQGTRKRAANPQVAEQARERHRLQLIRDRNHARRLPWYAALATLGWGLVGHAAVGLYAWIGVPVETVAAGFAAVPPVVAAGCVVAARRRFRHQQRLAQRPNRDGTCPPTPEPQYRRWRLEAAAGAAVSAGLVFWTALSGWTWPVTLVVMVATLGLAWRWWRAHPVGPRVPALAPPEPKQVPATRPKAEPETDQTVVAWRDNNACRDGKAAGSRLTNRQDGDYTTDYDVELKRGAQTVKHLQANRAELAGGLGEDVERVLFKKAPRGSGAHMARLTVVHTDPVATSRFYTGPHTVNDGTITGVGRLVDGSGEASVVMWDDGGTVPTMVVGSTGGGKSGATNVLTTDALSTGLLNLCYADPKGNSSTALASRARVAVIGKRNVIKMRWLLGALLQARERVANELGADQLFPTVELPGWMILTDEYHQIANDPHAAHTWTESANVTRAYAMWMVACNQSLGVPQWGNDHARSAFATQVVAFRINSKSGSDLVPGLGYDPNELPVNEDTGRAVPGMAVHSHLDTPVCWDFLPTDANAQRMADKGQAAPPLTTSSAFDAFFRQPQVPAADLEALETILGPAVGGRWQVGGKGATHEFPDSLNDLKQQMPQRPKGKWGQRGTREDDLPDTQRRIVELVEAGTVATGDIDKACTASRATVHRALDELIAAGRIHRTGHGEYALGAG